MNQGEKVDLDSLLAKKKKYSKYPVYADLVEYLKENGIGKVVFFGASEGGKEIYAKLMKDCIHVSYFCDNDSKKWGNSFLGKKIIPPFQLKTDDHIVISSSFQDEIYCQLREAGLKNLYHFPMVDIITKEHYQEEIIYRNENIIKKLYNTLADAESKKVFSNVIAYRLTDDPCYIREILSPDDQYFPKIINLNDNEVFVDIAAFEGDTLKIFLDKTRNLKSITAIAFEPDKVNYKRLCGVRGYGQKVECHNNIVYDKNTTLYFNDGKGDQSSYSASLTNTRVEAISLDSFFQNRDKPTYIKMDVEGSEAQVINGAQKIVSEYLPKLAVSVYHKSNDLWAIPQLLNSITSSYDFYLRHHSHNICDTVLYCLPKSDKG